jgi:hypothetical protein
MLNRNECPLKSYRPIVQNILFGKCLEGQHAWYVSIRTAQTYLHSAIHQFFKPHEDSISRTKFSSLACASLCRFV